VKVNPEAVYKNRVRLVNSFIAELEGYYRLYLTEQITLITNARSEEEQFSLLAEMRSGLPSEVTDRVENVTEMFLYELEVLQHDFEFESSEVAMINNLIVNEVATVIGVLQGINISVSSQVARQIYIGIKDIKVNDLFDKIGLPRIYQIRTSLHTALTSFRRSSVIQKSLKKGTRRFRYIKVRKAKTPPRPFCAERQGKIFTYEEIQQMDNGQGLTPVFIYGGGYNCTHDWEPVANEEE